MTREPTRQVAIMPSDLLIGAFGPQLPTKLTRRGALKTAGSVLTGAALSTVPILGSSANVHAADSILLWPATSAQPSGVPAGQSIDEVRRTKDVTVPGGDWKIARTGVDDTVRVIKNGVAHDFDYFTQDREFSITSLLDAGSDTTLTFQVVDKSGPHWGHGELG